MSADEYPAADLDRAEQDLAFILDDQAWPEGGECCVPGSLFLKLRDRGFPFMLIKALVQRLVNEGVFRYHEVVTPAGYRPDGSWCDVPEVKMFWVTTRERWRTYLARLAPSATTTTDQAGTGQGEGAAQSDDTDAILRRTAEQEAQREERQGRAEQGGPSLQVVQRRLANREEEVRDTSEHPIIRQLREEGERREADKRFQQERVKRRMHLAELRTAIAYYGETATTEESASLNGLAELIGQFVTAVRAAGKEASLQVLDNPGPPAWVCAVNVYQLCGRGDIAVGAELLRQATTMTAWSAVLDLVKRRIPEVIDDDPTCGDMIPVASDVPDLGKADTIPEFREWCNRHREGLRAFRVRLGEPPPACVATDEFRVIPEIVHQCRDYLLGFGAGEIPDHFSFPTLPPHQTPTGPEYFASEMEEFLAWASTYRVPGHGAMKLIGRVEAFLTWAMGWCHRAQSEPPGSEGQTQDEVPSAKTNAANAETEKRRRKRGRPRDTDPKADKRIADAWQSGQHKTYADLARELKKSEREVRAAIDRHRQRLKREGR